MERASRHICRESQAASSWDKCAHEAGKIVEFCWYEQWQTVLKFKNVVVDLLSMVMYLVSKKFKKYS